jgi:hypothetical protein
MFYSILYLSILFLKETGLSSWLNTGAHRIYGLGITRLKLVIFKGHLSKLDLIWVLLADMMAGRGWQIKKYDKRLGRFSCFTPSLMVKKEQTPY